MIKPGGKRGMLRIDIPATESPTGRRIRCSAGTRDMTEAKRKLAAILAGIESGTKDGPSPSMTFRQAHLKASREYWYGHRSSHHEDCFRAWTRLVPGDTKLMNLTPGLLDKARLQWVSQGLKGSTINRRMAYMKTLLKLAVEWDALQSVPKMNMETETDPREREYTRDEELAMLSWCDRNDPELGRYLRFQFDVGARPSEPLELNWKTDVNVVQGTVTFRRTKRPTKRGSQSRTITRTIPLTARAKAALADGPFQIRDKWDLTSRWQQMRSDLGMLNDPEFVPHSIRHTVAIRLLRQTKNVVLVQRWLGHQSIQTTMRYLSLVDGDMSVGAEALEQGIKLDQNHDQESLRRSTSKT